MSGDELLRNFWLAVRLLRQRPAFAATCLATLILGISLNTIAFGIVNALWFRPLPFPDGSRMVVLFEQNLRSGNRAFASYATYCGWRDQAQSFVSTAAVLERSCNVFPDASMHGVPEAAGAALVSAGAIEFMGFRPIKGRSFIPGEENGTVRAVLIGERYWRERFSSDPEILSRRLIVDGEPSAIIGVLPREFQILYGGYQVVGLLDHKAESSDRTERMLQVIARLKPGISLDQARAEMKVISARISLLSPASNREWEARVADYRKFLFATAIRMYPLLLAGSVFVLLIVCANISNLYLALSIARRKEIAVRAALGATRWQIVRQMLAEGLVLSIGGGLIAFTLVVWARYLLVAGYPELSNLKVDIRVFSYTMLVSFAAGMAFGLTPALTASKPDISEVLKSSGRSGQARSTLRLRRLLVASELALSLILLTATGLLVRTAIKMRVAEPGFKPARLLTAHLTLRGNRYSSAADKARFTRYLQEQVAGMPGIEGATLMGRLPLLGGDPTSRLEVSDADGWSCQVIVRPVDSEFHGVLSNRMLAGRRFLPADAEDSEPTAILNEKLAGSISPGNPAGALDHRIRIDDGSWRRVVGISADVRQLLTQPAGAEVLVPLAQQPSSNIWIAVLARGDPDSIANSLRKKVAGMDPALPVGALQTMSDIVDGYFPRVMMAGLACFSIVALSIAALGLYGVVASTVLERTQEIGVRMALGANRRTILQNIISDGIRLAAWGAVSGLLGAFALGRVMAGFLFDVSPADPVVFTVIPVLLMLVVVCAAYVPSRRASRLDPVVALREE